MVGIHYCTSGEELGCLLLANSVALHDLCSLGQS